MNKTFKLYGIIFITVLVILALLQLNKGEVTDWRKNFDVKEKSPFGLFVFNREADNLFKKNLNRIGASPYAFYSDSSTIAPHNILIIQRDVDGQSLNTLLEQVAAGSSAMIFSTELGTELTDTLTVDFSVGFNESGNRLILTDRKFRADSLLTDKRPSGVVYHSLGKDTEVLGASRNSDGVMSPNFVKVKHGKGHFYLHCEPLVLTNYYLLQPGSEAYVQNVLSYLPDRPTIWFSESGKVQSSSPMRFILSQPALKYAWWLLLAAMLVFVVFNVKIKQRIVPIKEPLRNKSVEFVKSIGNLYLQEGDFHDMMAKKAQYFLNKVRMDLLLDTRVLDEQFAKKLHLKTGHDVQKIDEAIVLLNKAQDPYASVMRDDLVRMNRLLDEILR